MEHLIGVICEAFNCPPDIALRQDLRLCRAVIEARMIENAKAQHNEDATKMSADATALWMEAMEALNS